MTENHISGVEMNKRRTHTNEFKARVALEAVRGDKTINEIASDYKIHPNMIAKWKKQLIERIPDVFEHGIKEKPDDAEKEELYKQIGKMKVELDWLKKKVGLIS
jgi:transposase-like protein